MGKWKGIERREAKTPVMIEVVIGEVRGALVAEGKKMKGLEVGHGEVVVVVVAGGIGLLLLLEEGLLQGVVHPLEEVHPLGVDLPLVEDLVMMDPLIGAATDLLPVTTLHPPNQDQPVNTKMKAGRLSSVRPSASWDSPGSCDIIVRLPGFITLVGFC